MRDRRLRAPRPYTECDPEPLAALAAGQEVRQGLLVPPRAARSWPRAIRYAGAAIEWESSGGAAGLCVIPGAAELAGLVVVLPDRRARRL